MIFLTIGTLTGFDRLVKAVDDLIEKDRIQTEVFAQIGPGLYKPRNMEYAIHLPRNEFESIIQNTVAIISHAGMGSISMAITFNKPLLVMPRLKKYREHVNNHQLDSARKFEEMGHILVAYDENELPDKIKQLKTFTPKPRVPNRQGVIDQIMCFMQSL